MKKHTSIELKSLDETLQAVNVIFTHIYSTDQLSLDQKLVFVEDVRNLLDLMEESWAAPVPKRDQMN